MALEPIEITNFAYSIQNAARALGVSRGTVYKLIGEKALPFLKIGGRTLIAADDLKDFIASLPRQDSLPNPAGVAAASRARRAGGRHAQPQSQPSGP